jgi:hypothetical protein
LNCLAKNIIGFIHVGSSDIAEVVFGLVRILLKRGVNYLYKLVMLASEVSYGVQTFKKWVILNIL